MSTTVYVGLGSNLGNREKSIRSALEKMGELPGTTVEQVSRLTETAPVGPIQDQPTYLNAVAKVQTELDPLELLEGLLGIEQSLGRVRKERWGPRTIDLDILIMGDLTMHHPRLRLPHPEIQNRPFVLDALRELNAF